MICYDMLCYAMLCYAMLCKALLNYNMLRDAIRCYAISESEAFQQHIYM